jgi:hypothetical protein
MQSLKVLLIALTFVLLAACNSSTEKRSGADVATESANERAELLARVDAYLRENKLREAEILLSRAAQQHPNDFSLQSRLFGVSLSQARDKLLKATYAQAGEDADAAEASLIAMKSIAIDPSANVPKEFAAIITSSEGELKDVKRRLNVAVDSTCRALLSVAEGHAGEAKKYIGRNDRQQIISGLSQVRKCATNSKWLSVELKGQATQATEKLLKLASPEERDSLLRSAGFGFEK